MTRKEFYNRHNEMFDHFDTSDVLMRIASNLSDLHNAKNLSQEQLDNRLNSLKEYIFDYKRVLWSES